MKPEQLHLARELLQLTQRELAQVLGVHHLTISRWERGKLQPKPLHLAIVEGFLQSVSDDAPEPRALGQSIRKMLSKGKLLRAHAALVFYSVPKQ